MRELFLGIDGGGSKTEFMVADSELRPITTIRIARGANPWSQGVETTLAVLKEGLDRLEAYADGIVYCVAGISGCFTPNDHSKTIEEYLRSRLKHVDVVGDLPISFQAGTDATSGIIAIAGSGSAVVQFFEDGTHYLYDGVAAGGRDLGFWLAQAYGRSRLSDETSAYLREIAPVLGTDKLKKIEDYYHNDELRYMAEKISLLNQHSTLWAELSPWIDVVADRWQYKLYGIINKFMQKQPEARAVHLVLSGGLWRMDYIWRMVEQGLRKEFGDTLQIYRVTDPPVTGAVKMARLKYAAATH